MKKIIKENFRTIFVLAFFFILFLLVHFENFITSSKKKENINIYYFDSIRQGDIIPFNSKINGNFRINAEFAFDGKNFNYFESTDIIKFNYNNVYFCKNEKCINNGKYNAVNTLYSVGGSTEFSYNVPSYNSVFSTNNKKYKAWKVFFVKTYHMQGYSTHYGGTFYDLVFVPTVDEVNSCINEDELIYGKDLEYVVTDKTNSWLIDGNKYDLEKNVDGVLEFEFAAKKGDKIFFDIKTTSSTLKIYLNDEIINNKLNMDNINSLYNYYERYNNTIYNITDDDTYILRFEDNVNKDKNHEKFYSFVSIKDFMIFRPANKEESNKYYTYCNFDILVGSSDGV